MIKFVHRKHMNKRVESHKLVIYYSYSEIILSVVYLGMIGFFLYNYLQYKFYKPAQMSYSHTLVPMGNSK